MRLIEVQTSKDGEEKCFKDIYLKDLRNDTNRFISSILDESEDSNIVSIWISNDDNLEDIYDDTIDGDNIGQILLKWIYKIKEKYED